MIGGRSSMCLICGGGERERERQRREGSAGDSSVQSALTVYFIAFSLK